MQPILVYAAGGFRSFAVVVGLSGKHDSLEPGGLVWDQADGAFGSAAVPRPAGSSFMPLRRTHRRPGPAKSLERRAPKPPARARGWGSGLALRYCKTRPDPFRSDPFRSGGGFWCAAFQRLCRIRSAVRSAQRHKGGARRAGDSRGAECAVGLVPHQAAGIQAFMFSGQTNNVRNGPKAGSEEARHSRARVVATV